MRRRELFIVDDDIQIHDVGGGVQKRSSWFARRTNVELKLFRKAAVSLRLMFVADEV